MPRQARLDAPGALHHVMDRGIYGTKAFSDKKDRENFLELLADLCRADALRFNTWASLCNHVIVRNG